MIAGDGGQVDKLKGLAAALGPKRMLAMAGVALALLAALAFIAVGSSGSGRMSYLYTDLEPDAAKGMVEQLQAQSVPFELAGGGSAILVPDERVAELRMAMAGQQLGGKIGYAVLDDQQPFGISAAREKLNETRAIEGELARSIATLQSISAARVHIVMPERALFAAEQRRASASVTVKTAGRLSGENVDAIRYLVAAAVPDLAPEAISVVDQNGALLARAGEAGSAGGALADERQQAVEGRIREQVVALLEPLVGQGKVRAEVTAAIERDQVREEAEIFDPDAAVIQRQVSVEAGDRSSEAGAVGAAASVAGQLPDAPAIGPAGGGDGRQSASNETSEDTTYQNSARRTLTVRAPGKLTRLTVAVMLDAKSLPPERQRKLQALVENAVGFDAERGDSVVIEAMEFARVEEPATFAESLLDSLPLGALFDLAKLLLVAGVGLVALRMVRGKPGAPGTALALAAPGQAGPIDLTPHNRAGDAALGEIQSRNAELNLLEEGIDQARVEGNIKSSALQKIGDTIQASPAESASVIRQWMNS